MFLRIALCITLSLCLIVPAGADELEGNQLYRISTVRAAAGSLPELLEQIGTTKKSSNSPLVMRHSQGDQWDLMIIEAIQPIDAMDSGFLANLGALIAFEENHFVYGPSWQAVSSAFGIPEGITPVAGIVMGKRAAEVKLTEKVRQDAVHINKW